MSNTFTIAEIRDFILSHNITGKVLYDISKKDIELNPITSYSDKYMNIVVKGEYFGLFVDNKNICKGYFHISHSTKNVYVGENSELDKLFDV